MNRIMRNCGRSVIRSKLKALEEEYGIISAEVGSAYTSQTCSCCGYVDRNNRTGRDDFSCLFCGNKLQADVNAARDIGSERFRSRTSVTSRDRRQALDGLTRLFCEWRPWERREPIEGLRRRRGSPSDPRIVNPYLQGWATKVRSIVVYGGQTTNRYE